MSALAVGREQAGRGAPSEGPPASARLDDDAGPLRVVPAKVRPPSLTALQRPRLLAADTVLASRTSLVLGPAGSGKTTALAHLAAEVAVRGCAVGWYRAEHSDDTEAALVAHLVAALAPAVPVAAGARGVEDLLGALEAGPRVVVVLDDVHTLAGTDAEAALGRLLDYLPPNVTAVLAARRAPGIDLSSARLAGTLHEVGADDLRFRAWEVERLFADLYREPLPAEDLAELTSSTEGWAAGLRMFHLATSGKPQRERSSALRAPWMSSRQMREYLAGNVAASLPPALSEFLIETCPLGRLSGALCDALLDTSGSAAVLAELEQRELFTVAVDDAGTYRYHEALRVYLCDELVRRHGAEGARARHRRAGELLEAAGLAAEALAAYGRAEDWQAVTRLLERGGEGLSAGGQRWLDELPARLAEDDPWVRLALARRHAGAGRWSAAVHDYELAAATLPPGSTGSSAARRERETIRAWTLRDAGDGDDWPGLLRLATRSGPAEAVARSRGLSGASRDLAAGLASLLAGHVGTARRFLDAARAEEPVGATTGAVLRIARALVGLLGGEHEAAGALTAAVDACEVGGPPWLAQLGHGVLAATGQAPVDDAERFRDACLERGDSAGAALGATLLGVALLRDGTPTAEPFLDAATAFERLDARVCAAWAHAGAALAAAAVGDTETATVCAHAAEAAGRASGAEGALVLVELARARLHPGDPRHAQRAAALAESLGLPIADRSPALPDRAEASEGGQAGGPAAEVRVRCLGHFSLEVDGAAVDLTGVKPRARSVLQLLALSAGRPVHRESICAALWPECDAASGTRNLQVAVSALRTALRGAAPGLLVRDGDAYRLAVEPEAVDVAEIEDEIRAARTAAAAGDSAAAAAGYVHAVEAAAVGEVLPEAGPAEWVLQPREALRNGLVEAARAGGRLLLSTGDPAGAAALAARGLAVDRYREALWRLLADAHLADGDAAAAARAEAGRLAALRELGVETEGLSRA